MTLKVEVPFMSLQSYFTIAYHISAYTDRKYRISLQDKDGNKLASAENAVGTFQSCVKMGKFDYDFGDQEQKYIVICLEGESEAPQHLISQISANNGDGEVDNVYFSDNGNNYYAVVVRIIRIAHEE